jgi:transglutaminase/protease-like cytokinesis protein 3
MIYFSLADQVYATKADDAVIILDAEHDQYLSIIEDAAQYLEDILTTPFSKDQHGQYLPANEKSDQESVKSFNHWIAHFLDQKLIIESTSLLGKKINPPAQISGGLCNYQWDTKKDWKVFTKTSYLAMLQTLLTLTRVNRRIKKNGMNGLFKLIKKTTSMKKIINHKQNLEKIIASVDAATKIYPQKTYCLGWAATFVIQARKQGIDCNLVIGVQTNPFYAHAWAELADKTVVHDDPQVAKVLSVIATIPMVN